MEAYTPERGRLPAGSVVRTETLMLAVSNPPFCGSPFIRRLSGETEALEIEAGSPCGSMVVSGPFSHPAAMSNNASAVAVPQKLREFMARKNRDTIPRKNRCSVVVGDGIFFMRRWQTIMY
jgi:hypothetical protein